MQTLLPTLRWLQEDTSIKRHTRAALCEYRDAAPTSHYRARRRQCRKKPRGWSRCHFGTMVYANVAQTTGRGFARSCSGTSVLSRLLLLSMYVFGLVSEASIGLPPRLRIGYC